MALKIPHKLSGVIVMFAAIGALFLLPWLDRGKVRSIRYRSVGYRIALYAFATAFIVLGFVGMGMTTSLIEGIVGPDGNVNAIDNWIGRAMVAVYFGFFAFLWIYTFFGLERTRPVPERVTSHG